MLYEKYGILTLTKSEESFQLMKFHAMSYRRLYNFFLHLFSVHLRIHKKYMAKRTNLIFIQIINMA